MIKDWYGNIAGVCAYPLEVHEDDRGYVFEILTMRDTKTVSIPHVYLATAREGVAKAFHAHLYQYDRFCVVHGSAKIGLVDLRGPIHEVLDTYRVDQWVYLGAKKKNGKPQTFTELWPTPEDWYNALGIAKETASFLESDTFILTGERPHLLYIPPGVAHGQMALSKMSFLINLPTKVYSPEAPDELRIPYDALQYDWEVKSR